MPAELFRVVEGPVVRDGVVVVPRGQWAVLSLTKLPDPEDDTAPLDPGTIRAVCRSEQEADRVAHEYLFGPAGGPPPVDVLDTLPEGDPDDEKWDLEQLPDDAPDEVCDTDLEDE